MAGFFSWLSCSLLASCPRICSSCPWTYYFSFFYACFSLNLPQFWCPRWGDPYPILQAIGTETWPIFLGLTCLDSYSRILFCFLWAHKLACHLMNDKYAQVTVSWDVCTSLRSYYCHLSLKAFTFYTVGFWTTIFESLVHPFALVEVIWPCLCTDKASLGLKQSYTLTFVVCI